MTALRFGPSGRAVQEIELDLEENLDAFQRKRVSEAATVYDCKLQYDLQPLLMNQLVAGAATIAHDPDAGCALLNVTAADGDRAVRQSKQYCTYQPAKSQAIFTTGTLGASQAGTVQRIGYYDDKNGVFFEQTSEGLFVVLRSSVTGATVDERVAQADWNQDTLDGNGASGIDIDPLSSQIFGFDLQWLGVGRVRCILNMNGMAVDAHEFLNDNRKPAAYWTTATLPIRYEIFNDGPAPGPAQMCQICCSVQSEGGLELEKGFAFGQTSTPSTTVGTTRTPVMSIRPKALFKTIENRMGIIPLSFDLMAETNSVLVEIVYDGVLTGPTAWNDVDGESGVEFDEASTGITGGTVIYRGFVTVAGAGGNRGAQLNIEDVPNILWLTNSIVGGITTPLTITAEAFAATSDVVAAFRWTEIR
jgi:hypothetical protein